MKQQLKCTALVLAFACSCAKAFAQEYAVGQPMPPTVFNDVLNYKDTRIDLSKLKGKTVILDFWGTRCSNCIKALPHLDSLQRKFSDRLQVIMVDPEDHKTIQKFFDDRKKLKPKNLPLATGNRKLFETFAVDALPFSVWIDSKGTIRNVTEGYKLTEQTLLAFINGEPLTIKQAPSKNVKHYKSAIMDSIRPFIQYCSYISKWNESLRPGQTNLMPDGNKILISSWGYSISDLYIKAYSEAGKYRINRANIIIDLEDPYKYKLPATAEEAEDWMNNFAYTYELTAPAEKKDEMYDYMRQDLDRFFGLSFKKEKRKVKAAVLSLAPGADKMKSKGGAPRSTLFVTTVGKANTDSIRCLVNKSFQDLASFVQGLAEYEAKVPFVDRTGYVGNIDICLSENSMEPFNFEQMSKELAVYGLKLSLEETELEIYVLSK
jgi:uncharacterized protein (TIGR03435 family)